MPDTAELRELESAETAWLFVLEGVGAWTNVAELAAQADYFGDGRPLWLGLVPPAYEIGIDILDARYEDFRASITLQDQRDTAGGAYLAALFAAWHESEEPLGLTIEAGDAALADVTLHGRHVGTERIGPAGQRAYWPAIPGWTIGDQHLGQDYENADLAPAIVSDVPVVYRGRRCSLFRVYRDRVTYPGDRSQGWRPWSESLRLWWGQLEDGGDVDGSMWSLACRGPDAYVGRQLATLSQDEGVPVSKVIELEANQRGVGIRLRSYQASDPTINAEEYGESLDFSETLAASYTSPLELIDAVASIVNTYRTTVGSAGAFSASYGQNVRFGDDGVAIRIDNQAGAGNQARVPVLELAMHEKVWRNCGWDPRLQSRYQNPLGLPVEDLPGFNDHDSIGQGFPTAALPSDQEPTPGPNYFSGIFSTAGHLLEDESVTSSALDFGGDWRFYPALYPGGLATLPADVGAGFVLSMVPVGGGQVRHTGQLDRPPSDVGAATPRQGLWLLEGPRVMGDGEEEDEVQVVVATWSEGDFPGSVALGTSGGNEITVTRWLDPRAFGIDRDSIPASGFDWSILQNAAENQVHARPVFRLGFSEHGGSDVVEEEILRIMLTTGACTGWTGFEGDPGATIDTTPNEPTAPGTFDAEVRDLGLAIPQSLVQPVQSWRSEFAKLPPGAHRRLNMLVTPGDKTSELFESWMRFYGLIPSLHGGQYGVITLLDRFEPEDVQATLTQASKATREGAVGTVGQPLRVFRPIDTFAVSYRWDPAAAEFGKDEKIRANDRGARYRSDGQDYELEPKGIRSIDGWRVRRTAMARFWEQRHFKLERWPVLSRLVGENVWPGTIVQVTEPRGVSQNGTYGIASQIGIVVRKREDGKNKVVELDILVQADASRPFFVMAPSCLGYGIDTDTNEILVEDDWQGLGNDWSDASRMLEPEWSSAGGNLEVKGLQWDGQEIIESWTQTVTGVTTTPGASRLALAGAPVGTYYRDMPCWVVPREYAQQAAAYALQYFAVIGDEDGEHGVGLASARWVD